MIKIVDKTKFKVPSALFTHGFTETQNNNNKYDNGLRKFSFKRNIYSSKIVKETLKKTQHNKCCFCESDFSHVAAGDVEHYRPKGGWIQKNEKLNTPGYYWLAYDWDNLFLSCEICNRQFKKNYFPLSTGYRARNHKDDISKEFPLFIHPAKDDPENHVMFNGEIAEALDRKGEITILKTGINRKPLCVSRKSRLDAIYMIYNLASGHPDTNQKQSAREYLLNLQNNNNSEYASMLRCFFRKNPVNF